MADEAGGVGNPPLPVAEMLEPLRPEPPKSTISAMSSRNLFN
jgi:hypothetical protein